MDMIKSYKKLNKTLPYIYSAPVIIFLTLISLFPLLYNFYMSLRNYSLLEPQSSRFIGLKNYINVLFEDGAFWHSVAVTMYFSVIAVGLEIIIGFILALLLNRKMNPIRNVYRTVMMLPIITTPIAVAYMWRIMYAPSTGLVNYLLSLVSIKGPDWIADIHWAMPSIIIVDVWQWTPFIAFILLSGLMSLPQEPFEAARVEGATAWQSFWLITLPLLKPVFLVALLIRMIDSFKLFDIVYAMTGGGPLRVTETFNFYIYLTAFRYLDIGYASALSLTLLIMIIVLSSIFIKVGGMGVESS
jgi:multiple sugar transport system permease protein